jgi:hypothetical protein
VIHQGHSQTARASMTRDNNNSRRQKNSLERAYHEIISDRIRGRPAESTIEALMYSLRRGVNELIMPDTLRRLSALTEDQLEAVCLRVQAFQPMIAEPWSADDADLLIAAWGNFMSVERKMSREEVRRRIALVRADNQPSQTHHFDGDAADLLDALHAFVGKFVAYPSAAAHDAHVLWIAHTHCMEAWESTPRLAFLSPEPASGKTRALEISELLVPNAVEAVNVSPAYLFRKVGDDDAKPTILYDEIDTVFGPKAKENEEIRGLLNAGHRRGAVAGRCVVHGKTVTTEEISAFCAVALAGLGWLPDTLLTRSVIIRMRRRAPGEKITAFRRRIHAPEGHALRDRLAAWAAAGVDALTAARPDMPDGIEDRNADVWEPLFAIADEVGGDWPKRARGAAVALVGAAGDAEPSLGIRLLADLWTVFGDRAAMATKTILRDLIEIEEAPWGDLKGKPLDGRGLARRLRQYGVKSKQVRIGDLTLKGYSREDFHLVWECYLSPLHPAGSETSETNETSADSTTVFAPSASETHDHGSETPEQNVSDGVSDRFASGNGKNPAKSTAVLAVPDVSLVPANGGGDSSRTCAQCNAGGEPLYPLEGTDLLLHPECQRFWLKGHPDYRANGSDPWEGLDIPDGLRRARRPPIAINSLPISRLPSSNHGPTPCHCYPGRHRPRDPRCEAIWRGGSGGAYRGSKRNHYSHLTIHRNGGAGP